MFKLVFEIKTAVYRQMGIFLHQPFLTLISSQLKLKPAREKSRFILTA